MKDQVGIYGFTPIRFWVEIPALLAWLEELKKKRVTHTGFLFDGDGRPLRIGEAISFLQGLVEKRVRLLSTH